jgi:phage major head subunit gpT-like protein
MDINSTNLQILYRAFNTAFQSGFSGVPTFWQQVATLVPSGTAQEDYGWLGTIKAMREWIGDRVINSLAQHGYSIKNKSYELTQGVDRDKIEDNQVGMYTPLFQMMGDSAAKHPDELIFALLAAGFATACYDGQYFFDTDHPVIQSDGTVASVSNMQAGAGNPWFLMDLSRPLKPLIFQQRKKPNFIALNKETDENVFMRKEYVYGIDCRDNVGFGFWQMAFGSKAILDKADFEDAYDAMSAFKKDSGQPLGVKATHLLVGSSNASAGRQIVEAQLINGGDSNTNFNRVKLIECPWLA